MIITNDLSTFNDNCIRNLDDVLTDDFHGIVSVTLWFIIPIIRFTNLIFYQLTKVIYPIFVLYYEMCRIFIKNENVYNVKIMPIALISPQCIYVNEWLLISIGFLLKHF